MTRGAGRPVSPDVRRTRGGRVTMMLESILRLDPSGCFVRGQFEFRNLSIGQTTYSIAETRLGNGSHLKGERYGCLLRTPFRGLDDCGPSEIRPIEIRGERNDQYGLKHPRQSVTFPHDD